MGEHQYERYLRIRPGASIREPGIPIVRGADGSEHRQAGSSEGRKVHVPEPGQEPLAVVTLVGLHQRNLTNKMRSASTGSGRSAWKIVYEGARTSGLAFVGLAPYEQRATFKRFLLNPSPTKARSVSTSPPLYLPRIRPRS